MLSLNNLCSNKNLFFIYTLTLSFSLSTSKTFSSPPRHNVFSFTFPSRFLFVRKQQQLPSLYFSISKPLSLSLSSPKSDLAQSAAEVLRLSAMATEVRRRCFGAMQQQGEERRLGAAARKLSTEATTLTAVLLLLQF